MSIYWNNVLIKRLQKSANITNKFHLKTDIGRFYFYFKKDHKDKNTEMSVKIIFFPK